MKKQNMPKSSMWEAVIWGLLASVMFSILGAAIGASIVNAGAVRETGVAWISALIWAVSIFCGVMLSLKLYKDNIILTAVVTTAGYLLISVGINLLFWDQQFSGLGRALLAVLVGSVLAVLINLSQHRTKGRRPRYHTR